MKIRLTPKIFAYYLAYDIGWNGLLIGYTVEILPYEIRAKGIAVVFVSIQLALFFNNYVNPIGLLYAGWKYYIAYDIWIAIELVTVYFLFPETKNMVLEEIAIKFDGENARVGVGRDSSKLDNNARTEKDGQVEHVENQV